MQGECIELQLIVQIFLCFYVLGEVFEKFSHLALGGGQQDA